MLWEGLAEAVCSAEELHGGVRDQQGDSYFIRNAYSSGGSSRQKSVLSTTRQMRLFCLGMVNAGSLCQGHCEVVIGW